MVDININSSSSASFQQFLEDKEKNYRQKIQSLPLFNKTETATWSKEQKKYFAAVFYHLRGYLIDFMWYLANFSDDEKIKKLIIANITEELGMGQKISHEKLYARFAEECDVDIRDEIVHKTHYLPFAQAFNQGHIQWLTEHDIEEQWAAFSAYERLDNIDYPYLTELVNSLQLSRKARTFFKVHVHVDHFEMTQDMLFDTWVKSPEKVRAAFDFIYSHQHQMWKCLSDTIFNYPH